jgi:FkbM family methyltransferase
VTTNTILSNLGAANNPAAGAALPSGGFAGLLLDHSRRVIRAASGFEVYGAGWLRPWLTYCCSPLLKRVASERIAHFSDFKVRLGECDLYTFANIFEDYPVPDIERALNEIELIVDLGANVGAFSCLAAALCRKHKLDHPIIAVEPNSANVKFLREQPFARAISIRQAAVGATAGTARLVRGYNSVSDYVDFSGHAPGETIDVISLDSLCDRPALVKMDIEGSEWEILETGLPRHVRHLVLEWHPRPESHCTAPADLLPGNWKLISRDLFGASMWYFRAQESN